MLVSLLFFADSTVCLQLRLFVSGVYYEELEKAVVYDGLISVCALPLLLLMLNWYDIIGFFALPSMLRLLLPRQ